MNTKDREDSLTLEILQAIDEQNDVTQRHLANHLGVALGLANSYLKRCVRKGLVKIQAIPANRYLYYLTPKGFAEKSRLTAKYLTISFNFYRDASQSLTEIYKQCESSGYRNILFCGISELAEIALIRSHEHNLHISEIYDPESTKNKFLNLDVLQSLDATDQYDACIITTLIEPRSIYDSLINTFDKELIFIPSILGINKL